MKIALFAAAAVVALTASTAANAVSINPGDTLGGNVIAGNASVYGVFGHDGAPGGGGASTPAYLFQFSAGPGLVFNISATGLVSCCSNGPDIPPDGNGGGMNVTGANGLSGLSGDQHIPLVGVFTSESDPFGNAAPADLSFSVNSPLSLSPLLNQVFYIGDGHAGYNDLGGALLDFLAPTAATRLYLGTIDGFGFSGLTAAYDDNSGAFTADVSLIQTRIPGGPNGVPEPITLSLFGAGLIGAAALRRKNRSR